MSNDDDGRYGFNPSLPWHIQTQRQGKWVTVETFASSVAVVRYLTTVPDLAPLNVYHVPTTRDGNADSFMKYMRAMGITPEAMGE